MLAVAATTAVGGVAQAAEERRCGALRGTRVVAIAAEDVRCPVALEVAGGHAASRARRGACRSLERGASCVVRGFRCVPFETVRGSTRIVCFHTRTTDRKVWWRVGT